MMLRLIFLIIIIVYQVDGIANRDCFDDDEKVIGCFKGKIVSMILRNRGKETFLPELSGTYNITAVQIGAIVKHCKYDCQGVTMDVFGKTANGLVLKCATFEPSSSNNPRPYIPCKTPMVVEFLFIKINGRSKDLIHLETYHLKFHYNMAMIESPCPSETAFPYVATDGEPCVFPFIWDNTLQYNCVHQHKQSSKFVCATSCKAKSPTFVKCLSLYPVPLQVKNSAIIMSSKDPSSADSTSVIDRISVGNFSECIKTKNSEREALKGSHTDINWILIDLQDLYVIQMARLWTETANKELELEAYDDIEVWISGDAPSIEMSKESDAFQLSRHDTTDYQFCGKVSENSLVTISNVFNIYCSKPIVGRFVIIQKSRTALKFCEAELYHNDKLLSCIVNGKATLDCQWKDEIIPVFAKQKNIYESPTFSRFYVINSFNLTALPNCTKCVLAVKLLAQTSNGKWAVCGMQMIRVKPNVSSYTLHSSCMKNLFINKIKIFIYHGIVDLVKVKLLLNENSTLYPTYHQKAVDKIQDFSRHRFMAYSKSQSDLFRVVKNNMSPISIGLSISNDAHCISCSLFAIVPFIIAQLFYNVQLILM